LLENAAALRIMISVATCY